MLSVRDVLILCTGFEIFNTISHIFLALNNPFPIKVLNFVITYNFNLFQILLNVCLTALFLWGISHIQPKKPRVRRKVERRSRAR
ncbi:MAG: hypothetical protein EPN84_03260 [Legionella sp.]|nr:MAG: hypothetical protein EPN84_03260 [Legionella sp.]